MTPYRQPIRPGQEGRDVLAVKRAMRATHLAGSGALVLSKTAGVAFVACLKTLQRQHRLPADGIYGPATHAVVAPHFDAYGALLYRAAAIRKPPPPADPADETSAQLARQLLDWRASGRYRADNPGDLRDLQATAAGKPVWSQGGYWVRIDHRPLAALVWLIEDRGLRLGTYAICSDHFNDGPHGHAGGRAVDVSSVNGVSVAASTAAAKTGTLAAASALRGWEHAPRQLICGGYGNHRDAEISACALPGADAFYGATVMQQHSNHLHAGW